MRAHIFVAALVSVTIAGAGAAKIPSTIQMSEMDETLTPIAAILPPMSGPELGLRCRGFFRTIEVRLQLAQFMGYVNTQALTFVRDLPLKRLETFENSNVDRYVTPYMREFGPLNPAKTVRMGLFNSDRKTCTAFLDTLE